MPTRASAISEAKLFVVKGDFFTGGLKLETGRSPVITTFHVDFGLRVFLIAQVQHGHAADYATLVAGHVITNGAVLQRAELVTSFADSHRKSDLAPVMGGSACPAVGLEHVAIEDDAALTQCVEVDDGARSFKGRASGRTMEIQRLIGRFLCAPSSTFDGTG